MCCCRVLCFSSLSSAPTIHSRSINGSKVRQTGRDWVFNFFDAQAIAQHIALGAARAEDDAGTVEQRDLLVEVHRLHARVRDTPWRANTHIGRCPHVLLVTVLEVRHALQCPAR